jgi:hypothetical protein
MSDKWDKIALELWTLGGDLAVDIGKALRDAEKAGMERAAEIIGQFRMGEIVRTGGPMEVWNTTYSEKLQSLIRAAKEET